MATTQPETPGSPSTSIPAAGDEAAAPPPGAPQLMQLAERMRRDLREELRDRMVHLQTYRNTFTGPQAIAWLTSAAGGGAGSSEAAVDAGGRMLRAGYIRNVAHRDAFTGREGEVLKFVSAALPPLSDDEHARSQLKKIGTGFQKEIAKLGKAAAAPLKKIERAVDAFSDTLTEYYFGGSGGANGQGSVGAGGPGSGANGGSRSGGDGAARLSGGGSGQQGTAARLVSTPSRLGGGGIGSAFRASPARVGSGSAGGGGTTVALRRSSLRGASGGGALLLGAAGGDAAAAAAAAVGARTAAELQASLDAVRDALALVRLDLQQHTVLQEHMVGFLSGMQQCARRQQVLQVVHALLLAALVATLCGVPAWALAAAGAASAACWAWASQPDPSAPLRRAARRLRKRAARVVTALQRAAAVLTGRSAVRGGGGGGIGGGIGGGGGDADCGGTADVLVRGDSVSGASFADASGAECSSGGGAVLSADSLGRSGSSASTLWGARSGGGAGGAHGAASEGGAGAARAARVCIHAASSGGGGGGGARGGEDDDDDEFSGPDLEDFDAWPDAPLMLRPLGGGHGQAFGGGARGARAPLRINEGPVAFESDLFVGQIAVYVRHLPSTPSALFKGRKRLTWVALQGKFKRPLPVDAVLFGQEFARPFRNLPAPWFIDNVLLPLARKIGPSLRFGALEAPSFFAPLITASQVVNVSPEGSAPDMMDAPEDVRLLAPALARGGAAVPVAARRRHFQSPKNRAAATFDTRHVYTFHLWQEFIDYATYVLSLSYSTYDLLQHLDGQPLQFVIKDAATNRKLLALAAWHCNLARARGGGGGGGGGVHGVGAAAAAAAAAHEGEAAGAQPPMSPMAEEGDDDASQSQRQQQQQQHMERQGSERASQGPLSRGPSFEAASPPPQRERSLSLSLRASSGLNAGGGGGSGSSTTGRGSPSPGPLAALAAAARGAALPASPLGNGGGAAAAAAGPRSSSASCSALNDQQQQPKQQLGAVSADGGGRRSGDGGALPPPALQLPPLDQGQQQQQGGNSGGGGGVSDFGGAVAEPAADGPVRPSTSL